MNAYDKLLAKIHTAIAASRPDVAPDPKRHKVRRHRPTTRTEVPAHKRKVAKHRNAGRTVKPRKGDRR